MADRGGLGATRQGRLRGFAGPPADEQGKEQVDRDEGERGEGRAAVADRQHGQDEPELEGRLEGLGEQLTAQASDAGGVLAEQVLDAAAALFVEEADRQLVEAGEEADLEAGAGALGEPGEEGDMGALAEGAQGGGADEGEHPQRERVTVAREERLVDDGAGEQGDGDLGCHPEGCAGDAGGEGGQQPPVGPGAESGELAQGGHGLAVQAAPSIAARASPEHGQHSKERNTQERGCCGL